MQHPLMQRIVAKAHRAILEMDGAAVGLDVRAVRPSTGPVEPLDGQRRVILQKIRMRQSGEASADNNDIELIVVIYAAGSIRSKGAVDTVHVRQRTSDQ